MVKRIFKWASHNARSIERKLFIPCLALSHGIGMLQVNGLVFKGAEVKRDRDGVPSSVDVNIDIDAVTQKAENGVLVGFTYKVDYRPDVGSLRIRGEAYCVDTPANIKAVLAEYKKKKTLPMEFGVSALNMINANAGMNSIFLIRPFNLLPPFMPPMIKGPEKAEKAAKPSKKK